MANVGKYPITSPFGPRGAPTPGASTDHKGIDVAMPTGTTPEMNGGWKVTGGVFDGSSRGYGNYVDLQSTTDPTLTMRVGHIQGLPPGVQVGDTVPSGSPAFVSGNEGNSTGPHAHVEMYQNGQPVNPEAINPNTGNRYIDDGLNGAGSSGDPSSTNPGPGTPGGGGGGAGCMAAGITGLLGMAAGGILGGMGLGSVMNVINNPIGSLLTSTGIAGSLGLSSSMMANLPGLGQIASAGIALANGANPISVLAPMGAQIAPGLSGVLSTAMSLAAMSSGRGGGGSSSALSSIMSSGYQSISSPSVQFASAGGLMGAVAEVAAVQTGNFSGTDPITGNTTTGSIQNLINNIQTAASNTNTNQTIVGTISDAMAQNFGTGPGGLGPLIRNNDNLATFGASTISSDLPTLGGDMIKSGTWDARNPTRLMQPGNIAAQIVAGGLGQQTGILKALTDPIPFGSMDSPMYDDRIQKILDGVNDPVAIELVRKKFKILVTLDNLGQLTDIKHMLPRSYTNMPVANFYDLGMMLISIGMTTLSTLDELGRTLIKIEDITDLNNVVQLPKPFHQPTGDMMLKVFGYGGGYFGETTMADIMGTCAGYVHEDTFPIIIDNINYLYTRSEATQYFAGAKFLKKTVDGTYSTTTVTGTGTIPDPYVTTITYTVPKSETGYTNGFIGTYTDTDGGTGTMSSTGLTSACAALKTYIEAGMTTLANSTDSKIVAAMTAIDLAHNASCAQIIREAHLTQLYQIDLLTPQQITPTGALAFTGQLPMHAFDLGHGRAAEFIDRVATSDLYGDAIRASMRMARNASILEPLGVNIEKFNLPTSDYYRAPKDFSTSLYQGLTPPGPSYKSNIVYPKDKVKQHVIQRDSMLAEAGYTAEMPPAYKEELYIDTYWTDKSSDALQDIGVVAVQTAINRNMMIIGNKIVLIGLDKFRTDVGKITANGIEELRSDILISTLMQIVNKIIYGEIGVSKNQNIFSTEQIIYGIAEFLSLVDPSNIDAFADTLLGNQVLAEFLTKLYNMFSKLRTINDTSMDRNTPSSFGGVGPATDPLQP